jgi:hypothetical protein
MAPAGKKTLKQQIDGHNKRNAELRKTIKGYGVALDKPRACDLNFYASTDGAAQKLAQVLRTRGCETVEVSQPFVAGKERFDDWGVKAKLLTSVDAVTSPAFVEEMARLAEENGAHFDGWGTALDEAGKPAKPRK